MVRRNETREVARSKQSHQAKAFFPFLVEAGSVVEGIDRHHFCATADIATRTRDSLLDFGCRDVHIFKLTLVDKSPDSYGSLGDLISDFYTTNEQLKRESQKTTPSNREIQALAELIENIKKEIDELWRNR
jgi:hypothetical protein